MEAYKFFYTVKLGDKERFDKEQIGVNPKKPRGWGAEAKHQSGDRLPFLNGSSF